MRITVRDFLPSLRPMRRRPLDDGNLLSSAEHLQRSAGRPVHGESPSTPRRQLIAPTCFFGWTFAPYEREVGSSL